MCVCVVCVWCACVCVIENKPIFEASFIVHTHAFCLLLGYNIYFYTFSTPLTPHTSITRTLLHTPFRANEANVNVNVNGGGEALGMVIGHLLVSWRSARLVDLVLRDNLTAKELAVHVS